MRKLLSHLKSWTKLILTSVWSMLWRAAWVLVISCLGCLVLLICSVVLVIGPLFWIGSLVMVWWLMQ